MKKSFVLGFVLKRLSEASTWRGIVLVLTSFGIVLEPELKEAIITLGLAIVGVIGVVTADKGTEYIDSMDVIEPETPVNQNNEVLKESP